MSVQEHFIEIIPRHRKVLLDLYEIRNKGFGEIGWLALREPDDPFTPEQLFVPLLERGLVEDLTGPMGARGGKYFVRITPLGIVCLGLGLMLKEQRKSTLLEMKKLGIEDVKSEDSGESIRAGD